MSSLREILAEGSDSLDLEKELYSALVTGTRASNSLPGEDDDYAYYASLPEFKTRVDSFRNRIVQLIYQFVSRVDSSDELFNLHELIAADPNDFEAFEPVADVVDLLLENVDSYLGEAKGQKDHNKNIAVAKQQLVREVRAGLHGVVTHAEIPKPQVNFADAPDNSHQLFVPKLKVKPHSISSIPANGYTPKLPAEKEKFFTEPQSHSLSLVEAHAKSLGVDLEQHSHLSYPNPYEDEIKAALAKPPTWLFERCDPQRPGPLESVPCEWIESEKDLRRLMKTLENESLIAVDLENHSYRSYQGFVCLMQISTRKSDFLIDTLALRSQLGMLNHIFANPLIVKVFHGSNSDVLWLQRDFGLYLVSLFDTGRAARTLGYQSAGLAYSLYHHCSLKVNKAFQLADWRIRPLPEDMLRYARQDTHYLLYIFDNMRNELLSRSHSDPFGLLRQVLVASAEIALSTYEKERLTDTSYKKLLNDSGLSPEHVKVFAKLYEWRDNTARAEDESVQFVLPNRLLHRIATELPRSVANIELCCTPCPPLVKTRLREVLAAIESGLGIQQAKQQPNAWVKRSEQVNSAKSVNMGVNSRNSTFVPISGKLAVSFAAATAGRGRTEALRADVRATPSPVLTTEQLYDTAGWQEIGAEQQAKVAMVRQQIGKEALQSTTVQSHTFGSTQRTTPFAAMATAMANSYTTPAKKLDDVIDIDTPANADALESDDIPRSMAEIYRISNRNRKRNKEKKKTATNAPTSPDLRGVKPGDKASTGLSKRHKNKATDTEEAVDFMRGIGWVQDSEAPVAHLQVHGAPPSQAKHLAGATADATGDKSGRPRGRHHHNTKDDEHGSGARRGKRGGGRGTGNRGQRTGRGRSRGGHRSGYRQ